MVGQPEAMRRWETRDAHALQMRVSLAHSLTRSMHASHGVRSCALGQQLLHVGYLLVYIITGSAFSLLAKRSSQVTNAKPYEPVAGESRARADGATIAHSRSTRGSALRAIDSNRR
jgi:hypothetical protein